MSTSEVPGMFDPPHHKEAEKQKDDMAKEIQEDLVRVFPAMVCGDVQAMRQALVQASGLYRTARTQFIQSRLLPSADKLKAQGRVFGYPLVSDVAAHLVNLIQKNTLFDNGALNMIQNDLLLLQNILWKRIKGDGGEYGRKILNQLI